MGLEVILSSPWYTWLIIPLLIFLARIVDVSMGTVRVIMIIKGFKFLSALIGFFEVLIWLLAVRQVLVTLPNIVCFIAYAGGFAAGTYIGILIEDKISLGRVAVRIITGRDSSKLLKALVQAKYTTTTGGATGATGKVTTIYTVIRRQNLKKVLALINKFNPSAFYSIEDIRGSREVKAKSKHSHSKKGK
ncbi:MAG: DUF5698 domain-containing protein [archaeon]